MTVAVDPLHWSGFVHLAKTLGFVEVAAAPNRPPSCGDRVRDWIRQGMHASMDWYARAVDKRLNLNLVLEDAASVVVLISPYAKEPVTLAGKKLARYACGDDYHDVLKSKLWTLIEGLQVHYPGAAYRPYVDTGPILERYWAQEAGLGWIGKSGNLINRQHGSYVFIACIVTNLTVPYGKRHGNFCGSCQACVDVCPTKAIVADGVVDSRKCISYLNIEHRGPFEAPPELADWVFGCDLCQEVCPWTDKFAQGSLLEAFQPRPAYAALTEHELETMDALQFSTLFRGSAIKRTKREGLQRNLHALQAASPEGPGETP